MALPWHLLSTGDNGITVDGIVVSGGYMNVICVAAQLAEHFTGCWHGTKDELTCVIIY